MVLDRRVFLKGGAVALFAFGAGPSFLHRTALAAAEPGRFRRRKVLVTIFQRGAMDALAAVPPLAEGQLRTYRPRLVLSAARRAGEGAAFDLDGRFGLHPGFAALLPLYREGRLGIVYGVGSPDPTRSHFDAQDYMETGTPGRKGTSSGWLNRVSGLLGHDATPFRSVALTPALPRSFYGTEPALAITDLETFRVRAPGGSELANAAGKGFEALYERTSQELLRSTAGETFEAAEMLTSSGVAKARPAPGADYPDSALGNALRQIAALVKADLGLEVAFAESAGWDTHVSQGAAIGAFARRGADLAKSIAAFWTDLGAHQDDVVLMTMTEFGRTVRENGGGGTDHGHGSCLFVLGNQVAGGKVHGAVPSLHVDDLFDGRDLPVDVDFRSVFTSVAETHLGVRDDGTLFPGWQGPRVPLWRS